MNNQAFDLYKMGVAPMTEAEMQKIVGGNIFKAIGRAASWVWDNAAKIAGVLGATVSTVTLVQGIKNIDQLFILSIFL